MVSSYVLNLLVAAAKVVAWFWIIFIMLPRQIFPALPQPLPSVSGGVKRESRVWADVVRMGFYTTIIVHILVLIGIYDLFSLMASYALLYLLLLFLRPEGPVLSEAEGLPLTAVKRLFTRFVVFGLDALEGRVSYSKLACRCWDDFKTWIGRQAPSISQTLWGLALLWVLLVSVYLRLYEALNHAALTPAFYTHLKWLKALARKELYVDGIYPYGAFTLLSGLKQFTFLDEAVLLQVAQGLTGGLTVAALCFAIRHFSGRRDAALLGASLYGIFTFSQILPGLPLYPNEALPLEMALAFLLPTWVFLARYLAERESTWLGLAFQGTVTVFLIHPFVGVVALAGWALALPAGLIYGRWRGQGMLQILLAAAGAVVLGSLFYLVGQLGGKEWVEGPLALTAQTRQVAENLTGPESETPLFFVTLLAIPLLLFPGGNDDAPGSRPLDKTLASPRPETRPEGSAEPPRARYSTRTGRVTLALVLLGAAVLLLGTSQQQGWSELLASRLVAAVVSLLACAVLGVAYGLIGSWVAALGRRVKLRSKVQTEGAMTTLGDSSFVSLFLSLGVTVAILAILLTAGPRLVVKGASKAEYDAVALKIYDIKQEHLAYTWTIIGTPEVLPHILGRGWYLHGDYFLQNYSPETYRYDPELPELYVPTDHVYIVIEKNVYAAPFTALGLYQRVAMEQGLWDWCRAYERQRRNDDQDHERERGRITIYYEDSDMVVFLNS